MKKRLLLIVFQLFYLPIVAQVGINTTTPQAQLEIRSSNQATPTNTDGLIIPKVDTFPATNPTASQQSMLVYLTSTSGGNEPGFYYWDNATTSWLPIGNGSKDGWKLTGNAGTNPAVNFIGTTDNRALRFRIGNIPSGEITFSCTSFGYGSLAISSGPHNSAFGYSALNANTTGYGNTAIGYNSLQANSTGFDNTAIGYNSLYANSTGNFNTATGISSLRSNTTGSSNTAVGTQSLDSNTNGNFNSAFGYNAIRNNQTGIGNTAIGYGAMMEATNPNYCIAIGHNALSRGGTQNIGIGRNTFLMSNGGNNIAIGNDALIGNGGNVSNFNIAIGENAMAYQVNTSHSVAVGQNALRDNRDGFNIAIGTNALQRKLFGENNLAIGINALSSFSFNMNNNIAIGNFALMNNTNNRNLAIGESALYSNVTGYSNLGIGAHALFSNNTGNHNLGIGAYSLDSNVSGNHNIGVGSGSLRFNQTGNQNVAVGYDALFNSTSTNNTAIGFSSLNSVSTSFRNTAIGTNSGLNITTGNYNTALGTFAYSTVNFTNSTAIGDAAAITASNQIRLGDGGVTSIGGFANWTNVSDGRFKINVQQNVPGLSFITKLKPVTYQLDLDVIHTYLKTPSEVRKPETENDKKQEIQTGFIAQEVEKAALETGFNFSGVDKPKNEEDFYGLRYAEFVVPLVKAVQEQQEMIEKLQIKILQLEEKINSQNKK